MLLNYVVLESDNQQEQQIVSKAKRGDKNALSQLVSLYSKRRRLNMSYNKKMFHEVCEFIGSVFDSKPCKMLQVHLKKCHYCEIFVDKIKKPLKYIKEQIGVTVFPKMFQRDSTLSLT